MKIFKAIIYAILLLVWATFTIAATVTFAPMVIICGFFPDEWFGFGEKLFEELKNI